MKLIHAAVVGLLSVGLSGCVVSEKTYVQSRAVLKTKPAVKKQLLADCIRNGSKTSLEKREVVAAMVDLDAKTLPQTFCRRILQSFLNGRMSYQDYKDFVQGRPTASLIRLMRGK